MLKTISRPEAGVSMLEVIITMALITIISTIAGVSLAFFIPNYRLKSAIQDIDIQVRKARLEAIRQRKSCYIDFFKTVDGKVYSPFVWIEFEKDNEGVYEPVDGDADGLVDQVVFRMPVSDVDGEWELDNYRGIRYDVAFGNADGVTFPYTAAPEKRFQFSSRGISDEAGSVHLRNARNRQREMLVALGGATRLQ